MDLSFFKVYSTLYRLGLSDTDYSNIEKILNNLRTAHDNVPYNIYYNYKTIEYEGNLFCVLLTNYDDGGYSVTDFNIQVKGVENKIPEGYILFDSIAVFDPLIDYFSLESRSYFKEPTHTAYNDDDLLEQFVHHMATDHRYWRVPKNSIPQFYSIFSQDPPTSLRRLFVEDEGYVDYDDDCDVEYSHNRIIAVINGPNNSYRIALFQKYDSIDYVYPMVALSDDPIFNYMDIGRRVYRSLWIDDNVPNDATEIELEAIHKYIKNNDDFVRLGSEAFLLTSSAYSKYSKLIKRDSYKVKRDREIREAKLEQVKKIKKELHITPFKRNGFTISSTSIEYCNLSFSHSIVSDIVNSLNLLESEELDFEDLYEHFIHSLVTRAPLPLVFVVNGFEIELTMRSNFVYINNIRIRLKDVEPILQEAIHFTDKSSFEERLTEVSKVNLDVETACKAGGVVVSLPPFSSYDSALPSLKTPINLFIPLILQNGKPYAMLGNSPHPVKCFGELFELISLKKRFENDHYFSYRKEREIFEVFVKKLFKAIPSLKCNTVCSLLREAMANELKAERKRQRERNAAMKRGKEFLAHAIEITKTTVLDNIDAKNLGQFGIAFPIYCVIGKSGTKYLVDSKAKIYKFDIDTLHYLCFVDMNGHDSVMPDKIARRLYMLKHDSFVANIIGRSDPHWITMIESNQAQECASV